MTRRSRASRFGSRTLLPLVVVGVAACGGASGAGRASEMASAARARLETSEGGRTVLRAIEAAGGLDAWYGKPTSSYSWEYANEGSNIQFRTHLVADNRGRRMYHRLETLGDYGAPQPVEGRFAWDGTDAWIWPAEIDRVNPRFWSSTGFYFSSIPFVLADPGLTYEAMPPETLDGTTYDMVRVRFGEGIGDASDTYTLYVDPATGRLRAIRYTVTFGGRAARGENLFYYEDYTTVEGLTVPTHFVGYRFENGEKGEFRNEAWVTGISFHEPFDESQLEMPEGARIQPMPEPGA